jgi:H+/Cl- antiporter ClcA
VFCAANAGLALVAAGLTVYCAPEAAGSGIPEVMGYLNGVHVPRILRLRTLIVKVTSSILMVCSGLALGVLGPLVHCGAIIGSGLTRGQKVWRGEFALFMDTAVTGFDPSKVAFEMLLPSQDAEGVGSA